MVRQFRLPLAVVLDWVAVDGLVFPAMDCKVRLPVAIEIQCSQGNSHTDWLLIYRCGHGLPMPKDFSRQPAIQRDELHDISFGGSAGITVEPLPVLPMYWMLFRVYQRGQAENGGRQAQFYAMT